MADGVNIELLKFHKILYAHTHTAENYAYTLDSCGIGSFDGEVVTGGVIEIGFVERIPLIFRREDGSEVTAGEGDVFIIPPMRRLEVRAAAPGTHRHVTTESVIDCRMGDGVCGEDAIRLPLVISGASCEKIAAEIRRAVRHSSPAARRDRFGQCADFMSILSAVNSAETVDPGVPPSLTRYCREAEDYILANVSRKLTVAEIAAHVGISKNYLTNIFSATVGMPIIEYVNRAKLSRITELILRRGCGIAEAAEQVGIDNVNYVSRIFRKYYGMTISQYKRTVM